MRPATNTLPKPLLPVAGEPFAVHQLRWLASEGVTDVVYSIGYLGDMIRDALAARTRPGLLRALRRRRFAAARYRRRGPVRGRPGRARRDVLRAVRRFVPSTSTCPRSPIASTQSGAEALMTVYRNDGRWDASNAVFDGHRVVRYDKHEPDPHGAGMHHIDYGLSVLRADSVRERLPGSGPSDLADMMRSLSLDGRLAGYEASTASSRSVHRPAWPTSRHHLALTPRPTVTIDHRCTADPNVTPPRPRRRRRRSGAVDRHPCAQRGADGRPTSWPGARRGSRRRASSARSSSSTAPTTTPPSSRWPAARACCRYPKRGLGRAYIDALPFVRGKWIVMGDADCTYDFRELRTVRRQLPRRLRVRDGLALEGLDRGRVDARSPPLLRYPVHDVDPQPALLEPLQRHPLRHARDHARRARAHEPAVAVVGVRVRDDAEVGADAAAHDRGTGHVPEGSRRASQPSQARGLALSVPRQRGSTSARCSSTGRTSSCSSPASC